jgi:phosphoserine aminotransferase
VKKMQQINREKADLLYDAIDNSKMFEGTAEKKSRSVMNVCFVMKEEYKELDAEFLQYATSKGMIGVKGHRSVGGFRASIYNALPLESVQALIEVIRDFENSKGV